MEDFNKKYNDALEIMRDWYNDETTSQKEKVLIESAFPELKDSDDKIKKELVDYLKTQQEISSDKSLMYQNWIVWLEKTSDAVKPEVKKVEHNEYSKEDDYNFAVSQNQEWSKEDEELINCLIYAIPKWTNGDIPMFPSPYNCVERLKSLKYRMRPRID